MTSDGFASAAARALAAELGVDVAAIDGTGRGGAITVADVRRCAPPDAPDCLGEAGAALWRDVVREYDLGPNDERILLEAARTKDELERLAEKLGKSSVTVTGSRGQVRPHPLLGEIRAHRLALKQLLGALGFDDADAAAGDPGAERSHAGRRLARQRWSRRA